MARRKTNKEYREEVNKLTNGEFELVGEYKNKRTKVNIMHKNCGRVRNVFPQTFSKNSKCLYCDGGARLSHDGFVDKVNEIGESEYEVLSTYMKASERVTLKHKVCGHVWSPISYTFMQGSRCPRCAYENKGKRFSKGKTLFVEEMKLVHGDEYTLLGDYKNLHHKTLFRHNDCDGEWETKPIVILNGGGCIYCSGSKGERRIKRYFDKNKIAYKKEYWFDDCRNEKPLPFDFAVLNDDGEVTHLVEYDGEQHFEPVDIWGGEVNLKNIKLRDEIKRQYCKENNMPLIEIPYWEYDNVEIILDKEFSNLEVLI